MQPPVRPPSDPQGDAALRSGGGGPDRRGRVLLALAATAVSFAAADTYVVVLALPEMMTAAGLSAEELHRGAPIISGFMLGYVAMLPLVGRIADLRGRVPVIIGSLVVFSLGSLVTAAAYDLPSVVVGRVLQGIGGGGLLPATLALVADLYPRRQRGVPLGVVGAVQEFGNVLGPLYGAVVLVFGTWRDIFLLNLAIGLVLAAVISRAAARGTVTSPIRRASRDRLSMLLVAATIGLVLLVMVQPPRLLQQVTLGIAFVPVAGESRWLAPAALAAYVLTVLVVVRWFVIPHPLVDVRSWGPTLRRIDLLGTGLLTVALAGVILAFATADPQVQVIAPAGPWLLALSGMAAVGFRYRNRASAHPLVPPGTMSATSAWGAMVVSFFIGAALIAALVDIPIFARVTIHGDSQVSAALVLLQFLVGLPVGAFVGGWWTRRIPAGVVTAVGMASSCVAFVVMSQWGLESLRSPWVTVPLFLGGLGVGLAMAPVNAALLAATDEDVHGIASALLVVARTVGKLVGISVLTTIGLRYFYSRQGNLPAPMDVCPDGRSRCAEYSEILRELGLAQLQAIFFGAAVCCLVAGVVALVVFRQADTRSTSRR